MFVKVHPDIRYSRLKAPTIKQLEDIQLPPRDKIISTIDTLIASDKKQEASLMASKAFQEYARKLDDKEIKFAIESRFTVYVTLRGVAMLASKEEKSAPVLCELKKFR